MCKQAGAWPSRVVQSHDLFAFLPQDIEKALEPVLYMYKQRRRPGEALGDFTARTGFDALKQYATVSHPASSSYAEAFRSCVKGHRLANWFVCGAARQSATSALWSKRP